MHIVHRLTLIDAYTQQELSSIEYDDWQAAMLASLDALAAGYLTRIIPMRKPVFDGFNTL